MSLFGSLSNFISSLAPADNNTVTQILGKNLPSSTSSSSFPIPQMLFSSKQQDQTGKPSLTRPSYNCQQMNSDPTRTQSSQQRQINADSTPKQDNKIDNEQHAGSNGGGQEDIFQNQKQQHLNPRNLSDGGLETKSPKPPTEPSPSSISYSLSNTTSPFTSMQPQDLNVAPPISKTQEKAREFLTDYMNQSTRNSAKMSDDLNPRCPEKMKLRDDGSSTSNDFFHPSLRVSSIQISSANSQTTTSSPSSSSTISCSSSSSSSTFSTTQFSTSSAVNRSAQMSISQSLSSSQLQMTSSKPHDQPSFSQSAFSSTFQKGLLTSPSSSSALPSSSAPRPSSSTSSSSSSWAAVPPRPSSGCLDELIPDLSFLSEEERRHIEEVMLRANAEHINESRRPSGCQNWTEDDPLTDEPGEKLSKDVGVLLSEENPDSRCEIQSTEQEDKEDIDLLTRNTISLVGQINEVTNEITNMDGKINERPTECPTVTHETIIGYLESAKKTPGNESDTIESAESEGPDTPSSDGDEDGKDTYELNERGFYTLHHLRVDEELNKQTSEEQDVDGSRVQKLESTEDRQQPASCQTRPPIFEGRGDAWKEMEIHDAHVTVHSAVTAHVTSAVTLSSGSSCQEGWKDGTTLKQEEFYENPEDRVQLECCACCGRHQAERNGGSNTELPGKHGTGSAGGSTHMIACTTCTLNVCLDCVVDFTSIQDGDVQICRLCHDEALQIDSDSETDSESRSSDSVTITAIQSRDMEDSTHELSLCHEAFLKDETQDQDQPRRPLECDRSSDDKERAQWDYDACELDILSDIFAGNILSQVIDEVGITQLYETDSLGNLARRTPIAPTRDNWNAEENWTTGSSESHQSPPSWCDWSTFDNPDDGIEQELVEREDFWHLEGRRSSDSSEESQEGRRQMTSEELRNKLQYFPTIDSEFDFDDAAAQKVTVIHFNRSDSAPCKSHKNRQTVEADYQRSHSVPKPSFSNLTSSFFAGSSFSVLSEGPETEESSLVFQDVNESMDSRDGGSEVQPTDDYKSESLEENKNRPPGEFLDNHKTPFKAELTISPTQLSHEQSDRKPSPGLDNLYKSLFDNSDNPLSQLFQKSKTATSPAIACLDRLDVSRSLKSKTDSSEAEAPVSSQSSSHPAVTFTNPSFKKEVNLHLSNMTDVAASLVDKLPFSMKTTAMTTLDDKLIAMPTSQAVISPSTFEKLLNEVREEENERERSWSCNPLELIDPCVEDSRVFVIKKTQTRIEKLNDYDFDQEEDPLESAFKGFSNQLASLTNADNVEKKPVSVRSLEDFSSVCDENQSTVKMPKTFKFPLKSVKSVPAFVNPSFLFDRNATSSQSSEDIINQKEPSEPENPYKQFQKSHSVIFPHATSASTATPNFNWSSLNDLSVPLEKVLAELDQTLKPFVSSSDKLKASDGTSQSIGFMKRCPSYSNILSHPLLVDIDKGPPLSAKVEPDTDFVALQASVDSSFAEVTATLQETTSELETLKFDLEHKTGDIGCKSPIVTIDEENVLDDLKEITDDNPDDDHKNEADKVTQCTDKQSEIANNETEINPVTKDAKEENTVIDEEKAKNPESKEPKSLENVKLASPAQIDDERKKKTSNGTHHVTQNTEENSSEIRANKSKSEIMRLLSMSRYRDMSPEPIYLEGLKSPCLMEPELDELHFLSDEELREIDLDEDIPPKHLFQFSKKPQGKNETNSKEDYFKFPNTDSLLRADTFDKKEFNYKQNFEENESEISDIKISVISDKGSGQTTRRKLPPLPGLEMFAAGFRRHFDGDDDGKGGTYERKRDSKSVKQTSRSLDLKERSSTANQTLSLDESKLSHFSSSEQGTKAEIMNDKVAFPEALLERFLDLKNSLFGAAEKHVSFDKPHLQRRHSSMWKETKRKYSSVDENKFLQRSDSVNCKSAWSVRSFSLDLPESDDEMTQATDEANFWRHAKTIDQRPSHLFGFVPRNEEDSDDASKSELDKNYCQKLLIKSEEVSYMNRKEPTTGEPQLTENVVKCVEQEPRKVEAADAKPWQRLSREDSDDKETVDIFGLKIPRSKHYLHQRVKDEIKIVTATKRLRIDEADEIRMMEAEMAVREKLRKARAQESSKATPKAADLDDTSHKAEPWIHLKKSSPTSSFSQDLMNVLNDITELPLLSERKQSLISSVSSLTSSSQSFDGVDSHNYIDVGPSECDYYGYYDVPRGNSRSRSSASCYSDSYAGVRGRKDTFESRSSQLIYAADDEEAIVESGVDFLTFGQRQSSYSLPGSRSTSMSRSINSGINEESYYNNFDYYNKYDPDYDYIVRLQKEEQLKQEKLTKLRLEIEKRRKHLQEIMPRQHIADSWQQSNQYHLSLRPYYGMNVDWVVANNYGNAVPYELEECPGIIKPIDYQIKSQASRQRVNEYGELPNERYYDYHQSYGPYYDHQRNDGEHSDVRIEDQLMNNRRTPVDLSEILGMNNEQVAREKLNNQILKSRSPAKSPSQIQDQNKKPYNGKAIQSRMYQRQIHQHFHHSSMHGNGKKSEHLIADTSDSEESLLQYCPVTCGSSRDSGVSSGEVVGEMFERSDLLATRSSSGDLLSIQTTPPPHYATGSRKRGGSMCRMGSNVLVDRRLIRQTNSVAVLKNPNNGTVAGELQVKADESKKRFLSSATPSCQFQNDPQHGKVTYQEQSDYSLGSYSVDEDGAQSSGKAEMQHSTPDKLKSIQAKKYKFPTKRILLTADLNEKKFKENGFGLNILGGQKVGWDGNERIKGALVVSIQPGSIADQLNKELQEGDEILEWNGECLRDRSAAEVEEIIEDGNNCEVELVIKCVSLNSIRADLDQRSTTVSTICTLNSNLSVPTGTDSFEGLDQEAKHGGRGRFKESSSRESCSDNRSEPKSSPKSSSPQPKLSGRRRKSPSHHPCPANQTSLESFTNDILALKQEFRKNSLGEIQLQLSYDDFDGTLNVHVIQARNLLPKIKIGYSDPLVKVFLLPYSSSTENKRKTKCVPRTLHPEWHQTLIFMHIRREDLPEKTLEVSVWDHDHFLPDQLLGEVLLDLSEISYLDNRPHWYPLMEDCDNRYGRRPRTSTASSSSESGGDTSSSGEPDNKHLEERRDKKKSNQKDSSANNSVSSGNKKRGHKSRRADNEGHLECQQHVEPEVFKKESDPKQRRVCDEKDETIKTWSPAKPETESEPSQTRTKDTHITWTDKRDSRINTIVFEKKSHGVQKCNNQHFVGYMRRTFNVVWSSVACCSRSDSALKRKQYSSYRNEPQENEVLV